MLNHTFTPLFAHDTIAPSLISIFSILQIRHDNSCAGIVKAGQEKLLRKKGQERWEISSEFEDKRDELLPHLEQLGFVRPIIPASKLYDYLVIFGFVTIEVDTHFDFISRQIEENAIPIQKVIILTSALPVPEQSPYYQPHSTEADMMQILYQKSILANYPFELINVPMILQNGHTRRPTTDDTIKAWLARNPHPGNCLALSGQPFIRRQSIALNQLLPAPFKIYPTGPELTQDTSMGLVLDELARAMYQEWHERI